MWHEFAGDFLRIGDFLCFEGTIFLRLGQIGFSCWELIFAISRKYQYPALIICSFLLSTCNRTTYFQTIQPRRTLCKTSTSISFNLVPRILTYPPIVYRFVSERKRQVVIEQIRFLSTVFLCSGFK